ncbi:hypothetical protein [Devosia sp.]|uniref:hypothetical protein n=1 Tax=Devosia sp. TaxID=1871048 RepID=UPI002734395B|nr:hypothetical protein [Devosia sp.]MDP2779513.1 hypothetical protein [Devosia sp.]
MQFTTNVEGEVGEAPSLYARTHIGRGNGKVLTLTLPQGLFFWEFDHQCRFSGDLQVALTNNEWTIANVSGFDVSGEFKEALEPNAVQHPPACHRHGRASNTSDLSGLQLLQAFNDAVKDADVGSRAVPCVLHDESDTDAEAVMVRDLHSVDCQIGRINGREFGISHHQPSSLPFSGYFVGPCGFVGRALSLLERVSQKQQCLPTNASGNRRKQNHPPLGIPIAKEYVIVRADGTAFLLLGIVIGVVSYTSFLVFGFISSSKPKDRNENNRGNKKP